MISSDKELAKELFLESLSSVLPKNFIPNSVSVKDSTLKIKDQIFDLDTYNDIYIFGSGKASIEMAKATSKLLSDRVKYTLVVSNYDEDIDNIEVLQSSHPIPSRKSIEAGERLINEFKSLKEDDFFIYLLSGGSSALIEKPVDGVSLEDFITTTDVLLKNSLPIDDINKIRKALSDIKGGGLLANCVAKGVVLVVSDVIGDDLNTIASAPFLSCDIDFNDIEKILTKYKIEHLLPDSVLDALKNPKEKSKGNKGNVVEHFILASNKVALNSAQNKSESFGLKSVIVTNSLDGDVEDVARYIVDVVKKSTYDVLLFAGEPTVNVKGSGEGGRNQELVLRVLKQMLENDDFTFLSAGSDGIDGNSIAAGGVVDILDLDDTLDLYLKNNDSYNYLKKHNSLIITKESGTNVMDIMIAIKRVKI